MADEELSQEELDALLSDLGEDDDDKPTKAEPDKKVVESRDQNIRTYDFHNPSRFSKEQINTIRLVHENFGRFFQTSIATHLRSTAEIKVGRVWQSSYQEFIRDITSPGAVFVFGLDPLPGSVVMSMSSPLVVLLIDRILGGPGKAPDESKELTDIEQAIIEKIVARLLDNYQEAWEKITDLRPRFETFESNAQFVQIVAPTESCAVVQLDVVVNEHKGSMSFCLPYVVLEPIIEKFSASEWYTLSKRDVTAEMKRNMEFTLRQTRVPIRAQVGKAGLKVGEFLELDVGSVLRLNTKVVDALDIFVARALKFRGRPGKVGKRKVVKITEIVSQEQTPVAARR